MDSSLRAVIVGASTLLGKELADELNSTRPGADVRLADAGADSQLVAGADEPLLIQQLTPDVFVGREIAFFAADRQSTLTHWREAAGAGARIIDLSDSLESETGAVVCSPWLTSTPFAGRRVSIVIPAHPAAVMLALIASGLHDAFESVHLAATVLEPASQQGITGIDELQQQTINLLGFRSLPQTVYDAQVAFNLRTSLGESARTQLTQISATIRRHLGIIAGDAIASAVSFQLLQAPVFHGYMMSIYVELPRAVDSAAIRKALEAKSLHVIPAGEEAPTNQSIVEEAAIAISLVMEPARGERRGCWLWVAADNLKLAARQAVACSEMLSTAGRDARE